MLRLLRRPTQPSVPPWRVECIHRRHRPASAQAPSATATALEHGTARSLAAPQGSGIAAALAGVGIRGAESTTASPSLAHYERLTDASLLEIGAAPAHVQVLVPCLLETECFFALE